MAQLPPTAAPLHQAHLRRRNLVGGCLLAGGHARQPTPRQGLAGVVGSAPTTAHLQIATGRPESGPLVDGGQVESAPGRVDVG